MDFKSYSPRFREKAESIGYSEENIVRCLVYSEKLLKNNFPIIYNTSHLACLVGYKKKYLKRAAYFSDNFYREFEIAKRGGKSRKIAEPLPSLKAIQKWILYNILYSIPISNYAKAYVPKKNIKQNLYWHRNMEIVLTLDITNFFPSIKLDSIENIFYSLGYSRIVANLLAKLCTKDDCLPQGAPTSPCLSNIFMKNLDDSIAGYCKERKIRFTRYADDITFSGDFDHLEIIEFVKQELTQLGFVLNPKKTRLMTRNQAQIVTGVVVNKKLQIPFKKRNQIRQEMYYIIKFGLVDHMKRKKIKQRNFVLHLIGKINNILFLNPDDKEFLNYKKFLYSLPEDLKAL